MPLSWHSDAEGAPEISGASSFQDGGAPLARLSLWPHRSLPRPGFAAFILITFGLILIPLIPLLGTPVLWGLLPFLMGTLALMWFFLERSYADGRLIEELALWTDRMELIRRNPRGAVQSWEANPYWVSVELHEAGGPVENYLTLKGGGREVEIGAFLSPEERLGLRADLEAVLARLRRKG